MDAMGSKLCLCRATCVNVIYRFRGRVSANILHAYAPIGEEASPPFNNPDLRSRGGEFATEARNLAGRTCVTPVFFLHYASYKGVLESFFNEIYSLLSAARSSCFVDLESFLESRKIKCCSIYFPP